MFPISDALVDMSMLSFVIWQWVRMEYRWSWRWTMHVQCPGLEQLPTALGPRALKVSTKVRLQNVGLYAAHSYLSVPISASVPFVNLFVYRSRRSS